MLTSTNGMCYKSSCGFKNVLIFQILWGRGKRWKFDSVVWGNFKNVEKKIFLMLAGVPDKMGSENET